MLGYAQIIITMKYRLMLAIALIATVLSLQSCTKDTGEMLKKKIVHTDSPPEDLPRESYIPYGESEKGFIFAKDLEKIKEQGHQCNYFYDASDMQWYSDRCGKWYLVPTYLYWGEKNGVIYLSGDRKWMATYKDILLDVNDAIRGKTEILVRIMNQTQWQQNAVNAAYQISWVP